jgi:hypothetical protein
MSQTQENFFRYQLHTGCYVGVRLPNSASNRLLYMRTVDALKSVIHVSTKLPSMKDE